MSHNPDLAGVAPASGITTFLTTPSSANLAAAVTDETGTLKLVFSDTPTITTKLIMDGGSGASPTTDTANTICIRGSNGVGSSADIVSLQLESYTGGSSSSRNLIRSYRLGGTRSSPTGTDTNNAVIELSACGRDSSGSMVTEGATIECWADNTWSSSSRLASWRFFYGTGTAKVEGMRLESTGYLGIGTNGSTKGKLAVAETKANFNTTDDYSAGLNIDANYTGSGTMTRHNYINLAQVGLAGGAALTDACLFRVDAAAGTHKMVDAGTTKTSPGTVTHWIKCNINGAVRYIPCYSSKTS